MNVDQLSRLARRAEAITGRADGRLRDVHARIRNVRRRRTAGAVVGAGTIVAVIAIAASTLTGSSNPAPDPTPKPDADTPAAVSVRALTWTDGLWPSRHIHYGDKVIDTRLDLTRYDFTQMDSTDDGVVVTTTDGRIWLADTESVDHIATSGPPHSFLALLVVSTGNAGSLAAWTDPRGAGDPTRVVYDTERRRVVARKPCPLSKFGDTRCDPLWVGTDQVYYLASVGKAQRVERLDVASGQLTKVSAAEYVADLRSQPRNLVVGESFDAGAVSDGIDVLFIRQGSRLVATGHPDGPGGELASCGTDRCITSAFDSFGAPVRLRVPDGYTGARSFTVFQWLDDDRLAMMAGAGGMGFVPGLDNDLPVDNTGYGDILVCRISTGACRLSVPGPRVPDQYDEDDFEQNADWLRIVPDYGTPGTN